ncbi:HPr-rel-A system PqqD family peptide chaperone [Methylomonas rivi]|uniref:HPr-rel-A system PqqD family peptide chaperone n=1 Tax=Methylomonas rivi TaxID=2952226 RepID=UPI0035324807
MIHSAEGLRSSFFAHRSWLDGSVVFDRRSGYTHYLDAETMAVFLCILNLPECEANINRETLDLLARRIPDMAEVDIEQSLQQLTRLNIFTN